jgi:hypothetical protein
MIRRIISNQSIRSTHLVHQQRFIPHQLQQQAFISKVIIKGIPKEVHFGPIKDYCKESMLT